MRKLLVILISVLFAEGAMSQYNLDFGVNLGASNYLGEMGGTNEPGKGATRKNFVSDMKLDQTHFAGGVWGRYRIHPLLSVRANLMYLRISGADSLSSNPERNGRNLHFRNDIFEFSLQAEYNFFTAPDITKRGRIRIDFGSYVFVGAGIFYHNPKAFYILDWEALQPLGTEGQGIVEEIDGKLRKKYSRIQFTIPVGLGFHYTVKRKWRFGWEIALRKTFTDYLDDASTIYIDPQLFYDNYDTETAVKAEYLANQSATSEAVLNGETNVDAYGPGGITGNPKYKDFYMYSAFSMAYVVRGKSNFYCSKYKFITGAKKRKKRKTRAKF